MGAGSGCFPGSPGPASGQKPPDGRQWWGQSPGEVTEKRREARARGPLWEKLRLRNRRGQVKAT